MRTISLVASGCEFAGPAWALGLLPGSPVAGSGVSVACRDVCGYPEDYINFLHYNLIIGTDVGSLTDMEFVNGSRHLSFEPRRVEPVSLERFWDEVAWQRRNLEEGDTLVPNPESRSFSVRYRAGGLPAERSAEVTATGTRTLFLNQHQWGEGTGKIGCGDCGALVRVERRDPAKLSDGELKDRVVDLAEARARLDGEYLAALGELASRSGVQGAAHRLREMNRMTAAAARSDARLALELKENNLGDTVEAMRAGEINLGHARVIAREAPKKHRRSEEDFLDLCRAYPADIVAKHPFAYESNEMYADLAAEQAAKSREPADAEYALQRAERKTTLNVGADGMWHLRGRFDFLTGRRINQALAAAVRSRKQHDGSADHTPAQHAADALAELLCGDTSPDTRLLILADYDHTADALNNPRLDDGTPLSAELLAKEALDAEVYCGVFNADWTNLALGRSRNASDAQRLILAARDGGCVHCAAHTEHTHAHHTEPHAAGGLTEVTNLELLCGPCHTHHHQTEDHSRTRHQEDHDHGPRSPTRPREAPTGTRSPPTTADTDTSSPTTRGP